VLQPRAIGAAHYCTAVGTLASPLSSLAGAWSQERERGGVRAVWSSPGRRLSAGRGPEIRECGSGRVIPVTRKGIWSLVTSERGAALEAGGSFHLRPLFDVRSCCVRR